MLMYGGMLHSKLLKVEKKNHKIFVECLLLNPLNKFMDGFIFGSISLVRKKVILLIYNDVQA